MKKILLTFFIISTAFAGKGQNLVPNGDFEQYSHCPSSINQIDSALHWLNPCDPPYGYITATESGSSDYFNVCGSTSVGVPENSWGYQFANSGNAYAGLYLYSPITLFREYIEVELTDSLIANSCYHFEMYVNISDLSNYTIDTIGIYFSNTIIDGIHSHFELPFLPQLKIYPGFITDTLNWTLISGNYVATGGENYLIIGNFNNDLSTNWYQINNSALDLAYLYIDDVSLTPCTGISEQTQTEAITIYPNPVKDELFIKGYPLTGKTEIIITDVLGKQILKKQTNLPSSIFNLQSLHAGIYLIEINNGTNVIRKKFVKESAK